MAYCSPSCVGRVNPSLKDPWPPHSAKNPPQSCKLAVFDCERLGKGDKVASLLEETLTGWTSTAGGPDSTRKDLRDLSGA